jgi:hypothetical protein
MLSTLAGLAFLAAMGAVGVTALRRAAGFLEPLERFAYGIPLGVVAGSLALLGLAIPLGLTRMVVAATTVLSVLAVAVLWPWHPRTGVRPTAAVPGEPGGLGGWRWLPVVVIGAFVVRWIPLWSGALTEDATGLWAGDVGIWGDWSRHLGDTASFAYSDNFPPSHPRFAGHAFGYHYLVSVTAAAMVKLGMEPTVALPLQSFLFSCFIALGLYAFARRLTRDRVSATLALVLFLLGGGLGWWSMVTHAFRSRGALETLLGSLWDRSLVEQANIQWKNVYFALVEPQRAYLYGLPLGLLILTLLIVGARKSKTRAFVLAGLVAGLLPLAHLGTLLALALITPFLFLLFPSRRWIAFFGTWAVLGVPQVLVQQGIEPGALGALRFKAGWLAAPDPWLWFWVKNLGGFLILLPLTFFRRDFMSPDSRRLLLGFMPVFVIANLVVFQPWDWDNTKVLVYWFLAVCILVAAYSARAWRESNVLARSVLAAVLVTMVLSGLLVNLHQLLGMDRHLLLTAEEQQLAARVRAETPEEACFAVGLQHNHPIPVLTGRRVLLSYPGWHWSQGIDHAQRERDLRSILTLAPEAERLFTEYGIDYVVIGPHEREKLGADLDAYRKSYSRVMQTPHYELFAVRASDED